MKRGCICNDTGLCEHDIQDREDARCVARMACDLFGAAIERGHVHKGTYGKDHVIDALSVFRAAQKALKAAGEDV